MSLDVKEEYFERGDKLFSQGDKNNGVFIVNDGEVAIVKKLEKKISLVGIVKRKEFLGGASLFSDETRSATAICLSNVKVIRISRDQILNFVESKPSWVKDLFKALVGRLNDSSDLMIVNNVEKELSFEAYGVEANWIKSLVTSK